MEIFVTLFGVIILADWVLSEEIIAFRPANVDDVFRAKDMPIGVFANAPDPMAEGHRSGDTLLETAHPLYEHCADS